MKRLLLTILTMVAIFESSFAQVALTENFESTTFPPTGWTTVDTHPTNRWIRSTTAITGSGSATVNWIAANQDESLVSPSFSLVGYANAYLNFSALVGYEYMVAPIPSGDLFAKISIDGGTTWTTLWVEEDEGVFADYDIRYKNLDLTPYVGQANVNIKFQYVANDADVVRIDDVSVSAAPSALGARITALADNTATATWNSTASSFDFEWGALGFTQGSGTLSTQTATSFNFTGLTAGTGYSYYIRAKNGAVNAGWQGPYTFYTNLSTPTSLNYSFGFESPTLGSAGWTTVNVNSGAGGSAWSAQAGSGALVQDGTQLAVFGGTTVASNAWLFSRGLNLTGGTTVTVTYYVRKFNYNGTTSVTNLTVKIGSAPTAIGQTTTLTALTSITNLTYAQQTATYVVPTTGVYYLGFNGTSPAHTNTQRSATLLDAVVISGPLSVEDFISSKFSVSPNPVKSMLSISNAENINVNAISIADLNGRVIKEAKYSNVSNLEVDLSELSSGMYIMNINSDQGIATKKIVKE